MEKLLIAYEIRFDSLMFAVFCTLLQHLGISLSSLSPLCFCQSSLCLCLYLCLSMSVSFHLSTLVLLLSLMSIADLKAVGGQRYYCERIGRCVPPALWWFYWIWSYTIGTAKPHVRYHFDTTVRSTANAAILCTVQSLVY